MKKILLSLTGLFILFGLKAQITLTDNQHNPRVGDSFEQKIYSNPPTSVGFGASGANVTWNFASLTSSSTADVNIQEASTPNYPDSDIYYSQSGSSSYFKTSAGNFTFMGFTSSFANIYYDDGEDQVRFPLEYMDTYNDSAYGTMSGFSSGTREVDIEVTADGYGTLITPHDTYNNAMRVQIVRNTTDYISGVPSTATDSIYYWYASGIRFPVMTFYRSYSEGSATGGSINWLSQVNLGIEEGPFDSFEIYPNPVDKQINIKGNFTQNFSLQLIGSNGKVIYKAGNEKQIPVNNLKAGMYSLKIIDEDGNYSVFQFMKK